AAPAEEPVVLPIGTEVSAKYKGAFCEAKIKKVEQVVKCGVRLRSNGQTVTIPETDLQGGSRKVGGVVAIVRGGSSGSATAEERTAAAVDRKHDGEEGIITKILDQSLYTVVFDDGDERTLKRTSLCLKSGKHFAESDTLDKLPLTHPEHFGNPVNLGR
ncbi:PREDICTED: AT-rich interactive domain-containing protein 4A-like, partial [Rhagoletis zephyria]|uniref:AT-rich interactive domain-containing protein 4A-like n=1 Tax=Rhagoletis zephyria TaxID=28612 RepID=UPI00081186E1